MIVGFTTTSLIIAQTLSHIVVTNVPGPLLIHDLYVIKFVCDLQRVGGFLWVFRFPPSNKTDRHNVG
jgi:hypothetical protein